MRTPIYTWLKEKDENGKWFSRFVSHFCVEEFMSGSGVVCVNLRVVGALEQLRANLCSDEGEDVEIIITGGTRSDEDNKRLAAKYGWTDEGGRVSRNSQHLSKNGACAVDFLARRKRTRYYGYSGLKRELPQEQVAYAAWQVFDFVKRYPTGHVHGDQRYGGRKC